MFFFSQYDVSIMANMSFDTLLELGLEVVKKVVWDQINLNALRMEMWSFWKDGQNVA